MDHVLANLHSPKPEGHALRYRVGLLEARLQACRWSQGFSLDKPHHHKTTCSY